MLLNMKHLFFSRIQEVDGGFFEKFGCLFREQAEYAAVQEQIEKQQVAEAASQLVPEKEETENEPVPTTDSETSSLSSDLESDGEKEVADLIAVALNVSRFNFK